MLWKVEKWSKLPTFTVLVLKSEKVHNFYTFMLITFFEGALLDFFWFLYS
jgi:hypothetical protein